MEQSDPETRPVLLNTRGLGKYKCTVCPATSRFLSEHLLHLTTHLPDAPAAQPVKKVHCEICAAGFVSQKTLTKHKRRAHPTTADLALAAAAAAAAANVEPKTCNQCGKRLKNQTTLRSHIRHTHENHREPCQFCDRTFYAKPALKAHMLKAHPEKIEGAARLLNTA